ncbi:MAG: UbiA-like polyprenyltransferase [Bacteroidales bacterium]
MNRLRNWSSLVKISHLIFSLPFAIIGFGLAYITYPENFNYLLILLVFLSVFFARNAAMAFNRYTDAEIDAKNERTKNREIPSKVFSKQQVLMFVILNIALFLLTVFFINTLCFFLAFLAIFVILFYSYSKRFTFLCHYILGLSLSMAPIGAFLAISGEFKIEPILLSLAVFFWVGGFDILYALQDDEFDEEHQLKSIPQRFGRKKAMNISRISHLFSLIPLFIFGIMIEATWIYYIGFSLFLAILTIEHILVKPNDLSRVNLAFATMNGMGGVIFATFTILDLFSFYF